MNRECDKSRDLMKDAGPRSATILIIDDDPELRTTLGRFLAEMGLRHLEAAAPIDGLKLAQEARPGVILLDLCLDGNNTENTFKSEFVLRALKSSESTRDIPVFAISGIHCSVETEARFKRLGAQSFFTKGELFEDGPFLRNVRAQLLIAPSPAPSPNDESGEAFAETDKTSGDLPFDLTVLIIDDEEDTSELLQMLYKDLPYKIHWAETGAKGFSMAKTELPDLAILDVHMPDVDGKEVCRRLRAENRGGLYLPILMLTGDERARQEIKCLDLGADDYLIKTTPLIRLAARIRGLVRRRRFGMDSTSSIRIGGVTLDCRNHRLMVPGWRADVVLTKAEAGILVLLMSAAGRLVEAPMLHKKICRSWPGPQSTAVRSHISRARRKLGRHARLIESVNSEIGYRFDVEYAKSLSSPA